ncbi:flagellin [Pseudomonadales bacterium]|nr:flagellin [Pseudomonadales bacterium]MDB2646385.1 flagellin [Pseudomonadales bacterium]
MSLLINTNVASLTAQRAIAGSQNELTTAMERLSTGSKINSASDDAAGLAMSQRMTAQIQGLNMAIKNSNDGIAMTKSIEGAIAEVSDMLQRMRELSVQAANGTNSASDRTYLQDEVNLLIQEVTRISANTRYNGSLILDGTFINKQLQVGIEEGEHITFSVDSIAAKQIGAHTLIGNGVNPETPAADTPVNGVTTAEDIEIFGYLGTKTVESSSQDTSKEVAEKVNLLTAETGVKAYAKTYAALSSGDTSARTYNIKINGYQTGNFIISSTDVGDAVDAVNRISGSSGVTAKVENNKVVLFDADGDDITIENTKTGTEFVDLVVEKLGEDGAVTNTVGQPIRLGEGATATNTNATFTQATGTLASYASQAHTMTDGTTTLTFTADASPTAAELQAGFRAATGYENFKYDVGITGNTVTYTAREPGVIQTAEQPVLTPHANVTDEGVTTVGTAGASADATRISGTLKFVSANSFSVEQAGATKATFTQTHGTLSNYASKTHTLSDGVTTLSITQGATTPTTAELVTAFQAAAGYAAFDYEISANGSTGFTFTAKTAGAIRTADQPVFTPDVAVTDEGVLTVATAGDQRGYFKDGSQTAALVDLTQVKISTEAGASDAISIIDSALDKVAQMRSDLGAIENRMDHTISNLMNIAEKTADSRSRLQDADFALESARLAKNQVLQQAGTSMLSQANQMSQLVMELLRG